MRIRSRETLAPIALALLTSTGCAISREDAGFTTTGAGTSASSSAGGGGATSASSVSGAGGLGIDGGLGGGANCVPGGPTDDVDGDGFTSETGDCNDCDPNSNPNAVEVASPPGGDEDCDDEVDEVDPTCDDALAIDDADPMAAARALDVCRTSSGPGEWGLVSAQWVLADGGPLPAGGGELANFHLGHGIFQTFGAKVSARRGQRMLALSSGAARRPDDPDYLSLAGFKKGYGSEHPAGFPKESPACPFVTTGEPFDAAAIELTLRPPSNAKGLSFQFDFFTYEWPGYICSTYNDFFVAVLSPIPMGQSDGNISFDTQGNPVSVNNAFLEVCGCPGNPPSPCEAGGKSFACSLGNSDLVGTGFGFDSSGYDRGSTGWLKTQAPVLPGTEVTIRFAVYDSSDGLLDTTTLIDDWQWIAEATTVGTEPVN